MVEHLLAGDEIAVDDAPVAVDFDDAPVADFDEPVADELPVRNLAASFEEPAEVAPIADVASPIADAPATMAEALGTDTDGDGSDSEDALARLVREAMQRAVENARSGSEG